jgi:hypothetical protein
VFPTAAGSLMNRGRLAALLVAVAAAVGVAAAVVGTRAAKDAPAVECWNLPPGSTARDCYTELIGAGADTVEGSLEVAASLMEDPTTPAGAHFLRECHEVMHEIGKTFEREVGPVDVSPVPLDVCVNGFVHGVYEVRLEALSDDELTRTAPEWCGPDPKELCRHLVGHVAMSRGLDRGDLAESLDYVLATCSYTNPAVEQEVEYAHELACLDGAYMQWMLDSLRVDRSLATDDPLEVCRSLVETQVLAAQACYRQVGPLIYEILPTPKAAFDACATEGAALGEEFGFHCVRSLAANIAAMTDSIEREARTLCPLSPYELRCFAEFDRIYTQSVGAEAGFGKMCTLLDTARVEDCKTASAAGAPIIPPAVPRRRA